jgi:hypothetical protein
MTTVKEILSANRDSVISSLKFQFKIWKDEDIKAKMVEFLAYAEARMDVEKMAASKKVKTELKQMISKMAFSAAIGQPKKSVTEMRGNWMDANNLEFDLRTKKYYKL